MNVPGSSAILAKEAARAGVPAIQGKGAAEILDILPPPPPVAAREGVLKGK